MYKALAVTLIALEAVDGLFSKWAVPHGFREVNPFMAPLAASWWATAIKVGSSLAVISVLGWLTRRRYRQELIVGIGVGVVFLALVIGSNVVEVVSHR